ncbi:p-type copper ATPase [Pseudozyma hubeiensis SY62]|uniref:P-type copper ATPase n=1 Tax=Pseudozyma hubeiensis (strain SY62) TaxID=1305764 RepID=R9PIY4_PSEHS|nr:p-type copper ATPase [Pseudozyma hubeiensis SY62]GAC98085.1 p-type copper ATPase [Pseudozyma hubeiensis SY62]
MICFVRPLFSPIIFFERCESSSIIIWPCYGNSYGSVSLAQQRLLVHDLCSDSVDTRSLIAATFSSYLTNLCSQQYQHYPI